MALRDDTILNAFIAVFLFAWNANTDMSPTPNLGSMIRYAAKYASKCEVRFEPFKVMFANAIQMCGERNPLLSASMKMLNHFIGEREWSAQETMHHLYDNNLVECTQEIAPLDLRPTEQQATMVDIEDGEMNQRGRSWLAKYVARMSYVYVPSKGSDIDVANVTLFKFVRDWVVRKVKRDGVQLEVVQKRPKAKFRVLRIYPKYSYLPDGEQYENYCRVKLMLHHPFVDLSDLQIPNAVGELSYVKAYDVCCRNHDHPRDPIDVRDEEARRKEQHPEEEEGSEADFELLSEHDDAGVDPQDAWTELAARNGGPEKRHCADYRNLGKRPLDVDYDWHASDAYYQEHGDQHDWYERKKNEVSEDNNRPCYSPDTLQGGQRVFFDLLTNHCSQLFENRTLPPSPLLLHLDGEAGTGKSYLIDTMSTRLYDIAQSFACDDPVLRAAPTGVAAYNIRGQTLHQLFQLPVRGPFVPLSGGSLSRLQSQFKSCHYLIIDEKSMMGLGQLYHIDRRLGEAFPSRSDLPFGGLTVVLCGDFYQLPPVCMPPLYDTGVKTQPELVFAQGLYRMFNQTVRLTQIMRQQGADENSTRFRELLQGLQFGNIQDENLQFLLRWVRDRLDLNTQTEFEHALRIYATRAAVSDYNIETLQATGLPDL